MEFAGFTEADFDVFAIPGLEARMAVLKTQVRPKLEQLGRDFSSYLTQLLGLPVYAHVAKHARRTVNPPDDTWVAFCTEKRGYKKYPHFQIGLWGTHAFATFGLIYESPWKAVYARQLRAHADEVLAAVPPDYVWIPDHTNPQALPAQTVDRAALEDLSRRLERRQGELLTGIQIPRAQVVRMSGQEFGMLVESCFAQLRLLYNLATAEAVPV